MPLLHDNGTLESGDSWTLVDDTWDPATAVSEASRVIVPFALWKANRETLGDNPNVGLCFAPDDEPEELGEAVQKLPLVAVSFPAFTDGRGYSIARLLRDRYGYENDLRAVGDVLIDQLFYMKRCGISSFQLREDQEGEAAKSALDTFSVCYQGAVDDPLPLFRRR